MYWQLLAVSPREVLPVAEVRNQTLAPVLASSRPISPHPELYLL